ncbi:uncharacterized protein LOC131614778 [Vicia villosa]|uniref:uncharacterized protein LOC131614778 n=1 Tax=Vicia villosa TaxID=3911 RepID=UPI00273ACA9D|nr:uncharacterized protein LOC131614778 [Vicia villosa]
MLEDPIATEEAFSLIELLTNIRPIAEVKDKLLWWSNQDGVFNVKSCYNLFRDRDLEDVVETQTKLALKRIWKTNIPSRLKVFGWKVALNRLPTKDQLVKRGIIRNEQELCVFCDEKAEDLDHLLFKCKISQKVWGNIYVWLDIKDMKDFVGVHHLRNFTQALQGKIKKKKLCLVWLATVWTIWTWRNKIIFKGDRLVLDDLIMNITVMAWSWHSIGNRGACCTTLYFWLHSPLDFLIFD